jgi:eukaryotic-like serine/threonine-protein kinase
MVVSSAAVVNDTLYIGSTDHNLYALNASDGRLRWKFQTGSRVTSSPAVSEGTAYFASYDSNFYAVDIATGKLQWQFKTGGEHRFAAAHLHGSNPAAETMPDPFDFFLSSPVVWRGTVYRWQHLRSGNGDRKSEMAVSHRGCCSCFAHNF